MAALVVREDPLFLLTDDAALLQAGYDALHRGVELRMTEVLQLLAPGEDRGLVADVREVRAGQSCRLLRNQMQIDVRGEGLPACVHVQHRLASGEIGRRYEHLPVEAARTEQRRIEILQAVRRAHDDDALGGVEAVELDEQLIERLVLLTVEAVTGARSADGVELIDEDDRRRVLARLLEELADA